MEVEVKIEVTEVREAPEVGGPVWRPPGGPLDPIGDEPLKKFEVVLFLILAIRTVCFGSRYDTWQIFPNVVRLV